MNTPHSVLKDFSFRGGSRYGLPDRNLQRKNTGNLHGEGSQKLHICITDLYSFLIPIWTAFEANFIKKLCSHGTHGKQGKHGEHGKHGTHEASTWQTRSFNPANTKLQPSQTEASTQQTRSFNQASTKLQPGKHGASTWQTRSF